MPPSPNKLSRFWLELKRRNVHRLMAVYAGTAYVVFEASYMLFPRWGFPDWTIDLVLSLLIFGAIITFVVSWIYDVTPEGIQKTQLVSETPEGVVVPHTTNRWKIASYISFVVIIGLLAVNIFRGKTGAKIDESLEKTIAVLPFLNLVGDSDQDHICVGLTNEIISHLYKVESFDEVRSLTSVMNYKDSDRSTPEIAEELNVNYVLEGSFKRIGDSLRITAQLIDKSDKHIWLEDYDRLWEEIITIPADIALQIAEHLKTFIADSEHIKIERIPTDNLEAYEVLKQARYPVILQGLSAAPQALELVLKAIKIDPEYADAYATAGIITLWKGVYAGGSEIQSAAMEALPFFEKALELDPNNASAHNGMGYVNEWARWDYINAEKEYLKAIELEPNNSLLYFGPIEFFLEMHRLEDLFLLIEESPEEQNFDNTRINSHILSNQKKEAYKLIIQAAGDETVHRWVGESYLWLDEYDSAKFFLESAMQSEHPDMATPRFQAYLALVYEKTNNQQQSRTIVNQLIAKNDTTSVGSPEYFLGWYYSRLGELDSAFFWLDKAYDNRSPEMPWLKVDPAFKSLQDDQRYWDLYERTGHKAYDDYMASKEK